MMVDNILKKASAELTNIGIDTAELDAKVLLKHVLEEDDVFLISHHDTLLSNAQYQKFRRLIRRRKNGEPVAYLTGHKEFYGLDFIVNKHVLVPRPETETLVQEAIEFLKSKVHKVNSKEQIPINQSTNQPITVLDIGTGSGCIIVSIAKQLLATRYSPLPNFYASDISAAALRIAKQNAKKHGTYDNIRFYKSDLFNNKKLHRKYDLILANLPYVPRVKCGIQDTELNDFCHSEQTHQIGRSVEKSLCEKGIPPLSQNTGIGRDDIVIRDPIDFEPQDAIFADDNGAETIKRFLLEAKKYLKNDGVILIELDPRNAHELKYFAQQCYNSMQVTLKKDLQGLDRCIIIH